MRTDRHTLFGDRILEETIRTGELAHSAGLHREEVTGAAGYTIFCLVVSVQGWVLWTGGHAGLGRRVFVEVAVSTVPGAVCGTVVVYNVSEGGLALRAPDDALPGEVVPVRIGTGTQSLIHTQVLKRVSVLCRILALEFTDFRAR